MEHITGWFNARADQNMYRIPAEILDRIGVDIDPEDVMEYIKRAPGRGLERIKSAPSRMMDRLKGIAGTAKGLLTGETSISDVAGTIQSSIKSGLNSAFGKVSVTRPSISMTSCFAKY